MNNVTLGSRDVVADSLRGFAIIRVVVGHVIIWLHRSGIIFTHDISLKDWVYSFHMPLMFMISGYVHAFVDRFNDARGWSYHFRKNFMNAFRSSLPLWIYRLQFGIYFHVGYLMRTKNLFVRQKHQGIPAGIILLTLGAALHFLPQLQHNISAIASAACTCLGLFTLFYALNFRPKLLTISGSSSMVMFIVHDYVIFSLALIFKFTGIFADMPLAAAILTFILAVSVPIMLVALYKNVNSLRWLEYLFYPGKLTKKQGLPRQ